MCVLWGISLLNTIAIEGEHFDNRSYPLLITTVLDGNDLFWQKKTSHKIENDSSLCQNIYFDKIKSFESLWSAVVVSAKNIVFYFRRGPCWPQWINFPRELLENVFPFLTNHTTLLCHVVWFGSIFWEFTFILFLRHDFKILFKSRGGGTFSCLASSAEVIFLVES